MHIRGILSHELGLGTSNLTLSNELPSIIDAPVAGLHMLVPAVGGQSVADGDTFTLTDGSAPLTFEFDTDPDPGNVTPGNVRIPFSAALNQDALANEIVNAINGSPLGIVANYVGSGDIDLGTVEHTLDLTGAQGLAQTGCLRSPDLHDHRRPECRHLRV